MKSVKPTGWFHSVVLYYGLDEGIAIYHDGTEIGRETMKLLRSYTTGSGHTVIGKRSHDDTSGTYSSVWMDEVTFWNRYLTTDEITGMYED